MNFEAHVRIDEQPTESGIQGVRLEQLSGDRFLIDHAPTLCWHPFQDILVKVSGEIYEPECERIRASHFKVSSLSLPEPSPDVSLVMVGEEQVLIGNVETKTGERGSKNEGSTWRTFSDNSGQSWTFYNPSALAGHSGKVTLTVREVMLSPHSCHGDDRNLCIMDIKPSA